MMRVGGQPVKGVSVGDEQYALTVSPRGIYLATRPTRTNGSRYELLVDQHGSLITTTPILTPSTFQKTVATSASQINASLADVEGACLVALDTNTDPVFVGVSGVTTSTGFPLYAGQQFPFAIKNLSTLYCIAANAGNKLAGFVLG